MITEHTSVAPMPPDIAAAVVEVMSKVGVLKHDEENKHNDYDYASVDAFLARTNPICAAAGLIVLPQQIAVEKEQVQVGDSVRNVMNFSFQMLLVHKSGATWMNPADVRTVRLLWSGAQTSGMAQSYVLKQYMRGLFQIATGDKDADAEERLVDQAPDEIAKTHARRKAIGKSLTSKLVPLKFGSDEITQLPLDEAENRIAEYLSGIDTPLRKTWRSANVDGLEKLCALDKKIWLRVGQMIEDGVPV